ncbi:MAG: hypothetical protein Q7U64_10985 [Desulfocapsaceae bacterium]|nr:hypothetical protein [Desulfocapsaceae bacterium]
MKHFCFNILTLSLLTFASLFLLFVDPALIYAEEKSSESVEPVAPTIDSINIEELNEEKSSKPVEPVVQEALPVKTILQRWLTKQPENGKQSRQQKQYYFIKRPTVGGQLTYEFKNNSQTHNGITDTDTSHKFKEQLNIQTSGWVYSPALMKYSLMIGPELIQSIEEPIQGETARTSSFAPDYSMSATFLEAKPYTLNIFGNRQETSEWAAFSGNTESISNSYGANGQLKYKILPSTAGYNHTEDEQTGFYTSNDTHDDFNLSSEHQTEKSNTHLTSTYSDDKRSSGGDKTSSNNLTNQIKTFNNNLFNNYRVTDDNRVTLDSAMTYSTQESGWFDTQNLNFREHLGWRHTPNLQSNYSASHTRQESGDFSSDMTTLDAGLTHLLYENLTTNVGSRGSWNNYFDGKETTGDGFLNFSYSRPLSWTTLGLNSGWDYLYTDRSGFTSNEALVTNETHLLSLNNEIYLNHYNVNLDSIIVSNNSGTIVYIENIDYTVEKINGYVRIHRVPFGSITDGQIVAVTYRYQRDAAYNDALLTENYGFNFDLWHDWYFSYNITRITQNILSGETPQNLIDDTIQRTNIRYDIGWSSTSLSYEDNNRLSSPAYTRSEIQETLSYRPQLPIYLSVKGYLGQTDYKDHDETNDFYGGIATCDWLLNRWSKLRLEGFYDKNISDFEETENTGLKAGLEFRYRIWTTRLSYQFTDQNYIKTDSQRTEQLARVEIIRAMW